MCHFTSTVIRSVGDMSLKLLILLLLGLRAICVKLRLVDIINDALLESVSCLLIYDL